MVPVPTVPTKNVWLRLSHATPSGLLPDVDGSSVKTLVALVLGPPSPPLPEAWARPTGPAAVSTSAASAASAVLIRIFTRASCWVLHPATSLHASTTGDNARETPNPTAETDDSATGTGAAHRYSFVVWTGQGSDQGGASGLSRQRDRSPSHRAGTGSGLRAV